MIRAASPPITAGRIWLAHWPTSHASTLHVAREYVAVRPPSAEIFACRPSDGTPQAAPPRNGGDARPPRITRSRLHQRLGVEFLRRAAPPVRSRYLSWLIQGDDRQV